MLTRVSPRKKIDCSNQFFSTLAIILYWKCIMEEFDFIPAVLIKALQDKMRFLLVNFRGGVIQAHSKLTCWKVLLSWVDALHWLRHVCPLYHCRWVLYSSAWSSPVEVLLVSFYQRKMAHSSCHHMAHSTLPWSWIERTLTHINSRLPVMAEVAFHPTCMQWSTSV